MEEEQQGEDSRRAERAIVYGRYTGRDGFKGWIQARSAAGLLYGDGAIELRKEQLLVRGWHRNWLGAAERVELVIPLNDITDAVADERSVRFVWVRRAGRSRQVQFHTESPEDARQLFDWLPREDCLGSYGAQHRRIRCDLRGSRCLPDVCAPFAWTDPGHGSAQRLAQHCSVYGLQFDIRLAGILGWIMTRPLDAEARNSPPVLQAVASAITNGMSPVS